MQNLKNVNKIPLRSFIDMVINAGHKIEYVVVNGVRYVKTGKGLTSYILPKGGIYDNKKEGSSESRG